MFQIYLFWPGKHQHQTIGSRFKLSILADYTLSLMGVRRAKDLLLLSRVCSRHIKTYTFLRKIMMRRA